MSYQSFLEQHRGESILETFGNAMPVSKVEWIESTIAIVASSTVINIVEDGHFELGQGIRAPIIGVGILYGVKQGVDFIRNRTQHEADAQY